MEAGDHGVRTVKRIEVYSSLWCPFCSRAKALLNRKGVAYEEIDVDRDPNLRQQMMQRAGGRRTVPQIFVDGRHIGGSDDLADLERAGELDALLGLG